MRHLKACARDIFWKFLFLPFLFLAVGCHSFDHEWQEAVKQPEPVRDIQGAWQGTWKSESTGHTDKLRCLISKEGEGKYNARFKANYHSVMSFSINIPLSVQQVGGEYQFTGDADLGWLAGGNYHYEGHAIGSNYFSSYASKYDHGTFQMERP
ncbi:hypothetical protein [Pedosphaera parvula]|uniref:Lipoprotein n=1 Tax=Pedosphaera parvula (strain Ellin514) TaxID=320771 RepID=B9XRU6_PEDPL|nr:hypothetical protein [Pedosphaera parvula]EEF57457.1 hypothetical protein Cflav_PD0568 [Pedosphaera parvula Ellin514]